MNKLSKQFTMIIAFAVSFTLPGFSFMLLTPSAHQSAGGAFIVFGPADYTRGEGRPVQVSRNFNVQNPNVSYTLRIFNGGRNGQFARSSSAVVSLNGVEVARPSDFNQTVSLIERPVAPALQNTLMVELRSAPGSGITIEIVGIDLDAPSVQITSPADGATLTSTHLTVTGTVSDATSGVTGVTCNQVAANLSGASFTCDLQLTEGANTIVVLATDAAGNVATASVSVTVSSSAVQTVVPRLADLSRQFAESAIAAARLSVGSVTTASSSRLPAGYVLSQSPAYGAVVSAGSAVDLVVSTGPGSAAPPLSFVVDTSITPPLGALPGFADGVARPMASIVDSRGKQSDLVENELLLVTDDENTLNSFMARWQGTRLMTIDPARYSMDGLRRMHLVRIDPSLADASMLANQLRGITPYGQGEHRVSSQSGLQLLAAAAQEAADGLMVVVNWVGAGHDFRNRTTTEGAGCVGRNGNPCTGYSPDAYNWSFMNTSLNNPNSLNFGVTEAWTALQKTGRINNRVQVAILDMGFWPDADFAPDLIAFSNVPPPPESPLFLPLRTPNLMGCSPFEFNCPWHGTNVLGAAMGVPDNNWGGAGPAGPVAQPIVIFTLYDYASSIPAIGEAAILGADIINMSYGFPVPAVLSWTVLPFDLATLTARELLGVLIFASSGNAGEDVDATDLFWEETWYTPCENGGVNCVGALDNLLRRPKPSAGGPLAGASYSNYGAEDVDIFAPGTLWLGPEPGTPGTGTAQEKNGTSYASPYAAGVAALIWAANPDLDADEVEALMLNRARSSPDPQVSRYVNAYDAVIDALGGNEPPSISIISPANDALLSRGVTSVFRASISDPEGLTQGVVWTSNLTSNNNNGVIGAGTRFELDDLPFGTHTITATVTDSGGLTDMESITVTVVNDQPPAVAITDPPDRLDLQNNQSISFSGTSSDPNNVPSRALSNAEVAWHLNGSATPFQTGHTASIDTSTIRPGMHAVTFTGIDSAVPTTATNSPFTASDVISFTVRPSGPLPGQSPSVAIARPANNAVFGTFPVEDTTFAVDVILEGAATDPEDGEIPDGNLIWTTRSGSNAEVTLGIGRLLTARLFRQGLDPRVEHIVTLYATDDDGNVSSQTVRVELVLPDSDLDGLSFDQEVTLGTDPFNADTDGDGVWDGAEAFLGTNPTSNTSRPIRIPRGTLLASTSLIQGGALLTMIDPATGNTGVLGRPNGGLGFGLAIDSRAGFLYLSRFTSLSFHNPLSGAVTDIGTFRTTSGASINISHIAFNPADNMLYGVEEGPSPTFLPTGQLVRIDPVTAVCTRIGNGAGNPRLNALAFNAAGALFASAEGDTLSDRFVEINPATGGVTRDIGAIGSTPIFGLAFDQSGTLLAASRVSNRESLLLNIDQATGAGAAAATVQRAVFVMALMPCPAPCLDQPPQIHFAATGSRTRIGDFNEDGNPDLVTAFGELFFGDGAGNFTRAPFTLSGNSFFAIATGDLNRDGHMDVVTADPAANRVFVWLGDGSGDFSQAQDSPVPVGNQLIAMAIGDLTNDGIPDLAASATEAGISYVDVLPGRGDGRFFAPIRVPVAGSPIFTGVPRAIAIGDLNGDGFADIASANTNSGSVMINNQAGGFTTLPNLSIPGGASAVVIGDFNDDTIQDLAFATAEFRTVMLFAGASGGGFAPPLSSPVPTGVLLTDMTGADMTGDGRIDLVIASEGVHVMIGNGVGRFRPAVHSPYSVINGSTFVAVGDVNRDGLPDVVVSGQEITVLLNH